MRPRQAARQQQQRAGLRSSHYQGRGGTGGQQLSDFARDAYVTASRAGAGGQYDDGGYGCYGYGDEDYYDDDYDHDHGDDELGLHEDAYDAMQAGAFSKRAKARGGGGSGGAGAVKGGAGGGGGSEKAAAGKARSRSAGGERGRSGK